MTSIEAQPDMVAQINSHLLEMLELGDDNMSFGNAPPCFKEAY
jgi:hypothetical protein